MHATATASAPMTAPEITPDEEGALYALCDLRDELNEQLINRQAEIRGLLLALVARQHVLLLGPPGVGKSYLATKLGEAFGVPPFIRLLTAYSLPEDLFGPLSLKALEAGAYERLTDGYLPTAKIALLDEIFKANAGILNALLTALNERAYDNGATRHGIPLEIVLGCSNEGPQDESLGALFDRFVFRFWVEPLSGAEDFTRLLTLDESEVTTRITFQQVELLRRRARALPIHPSTMDAYVALWAAARAKDGFPQVSDRRWKWCLGVARAAAVLRGGDCVLPIDLRPLADCLWDTKEQRRDVLALVEAHAFPDGPKLRALQATIDGLVIRLRKAQAMTPTAAEFAALRGDTKNAELALSKISPCPEREEQGLRLAEIRTATARLVR